MRATLAIDADSIECGAATPAVRALLTSWALIDWFSPGQAEPGIAAQHLRHHQTLARSRTPLLFSDALELTARTSGWTELDSLCREVRRQDAGWDWRLGALKQLCHQHSQELDWELTRDAPRCPLFLRWGTNVIWGIQTALPANAPENARWYFSYAVIDLTMAIEWQLAERSGALATNPFASLLRCYAAGCLPFFLDRQTVTLWSLATPAA